MWCRLSTLSLNYNLSGPENLSIFSGMLVIDGISKCTVAAFSERDMNELELRNELNLAITFDNREAIPMGWQHSLLKVKSRKKSGI